MVVNILSHPIFNKYANKVETASGDHSKADLIVFLGALKSIADLRIEICGFEKISLLFYYQYAS